VHLRHDRPRLLVADEDGTDRGGVVEGVEDAAGAASRHAEDELDAGFFEDTDPRVGNVDLGGRHGVFLLSSVSGSAGARARRRSMSRSRTPRRAAPRDDLAQSACRVRFATRAGHLAPAGEAGSRGGATGRRDRCYSVRRCKPSSSLSMSAACTRRWSGCGTSPSPVGSPMPICRSTHWSERAAATAGGEARERSDPASPMAGRSTGQPQRPRRLIRWR
jgi:hypothetical protein